MKVAEKLMIERTADVPDTIIIRFGRILEEIIHLRHTNTTIHTREQAIHFLAWAKVQSDLEKEKVLAHHDSLKEQLERVFGEMGFAVMRGDPKKGPGPERTSTTRDKSGYN